MGWKDKASKLVVGDSVELKTFPGFWIRPRKYTVAGQDAINEIQRKLQKGINKKALMSFVRKLEIDKAEEKSEQELATEVMDQLTEEEIDTMMESSQLPTADIIKAKLKEGIHSHNFTDQGESEDVAQLVQDIIDYPIIAEEMLGIVEGFNRPLAEKKSKKSKTQPSGSTTEAPLSTEIPSQTEGTPPKS